MKWDIKELEEEDKSLHKQEQQLLVTSNNLNKEINFVQWRRVAIRKMIESEKEKNRG